MKRLFIDINSEVYTREWNPIKITNNGPKMSHLFYTDDLTLFSRADTTNCKSIIDTLNNINTHFGQRINLGKSKMIFSRNYPTTSTTNYCNILKISPSESFGKYPGFPIFHTRPVNSDFRFFTSNVNKKLAGWKTKFLNLAGRTVLAKATLSSISSHVTQYISPF